MNGLKDKTALVTGGSRGIGRAIVRQFARAGTNVIVNYLSDDKNALSVCAQAEQAGVKALAIKADVGDRQQVEAMVAQALAEMGRIDILVNNAGIWEENPIDGMKSERLKATIDANLCGTFYPIMAVVPHMKVKKSGVIVNISSTAGQRGEAFHSPYAATKGAVIALTKSLAPELAPYHIRVNCVAPGWVDTDMSRPSLEDPRVAKGVLSLIPLGRVGTPDELAGPVLFLASDLATFITGEILNVNGGAVLCG